MLYTSTKMTTTPASAAPLQSGALPTESYEHEINDVDVDRAAAVLAVLSLLGGGLEGMRIGGRVWCLLRDEPDKLRMGAGQASGGDGEVDDEGGSGFSSATKKKDRDDGADGSRQKEETVVEGVLVYYGRDPLADPYDDDADCIVDPAEDVAYVAIPHVNGESQQRTAGVECASGSLALAPIRLPASCVQPMGGGAEFAFGGLGGSSTGGASGGGSSPDGDGVVGAAGCGRLVAALREPEVARELVKAFQSLVSADTDAGTLIMAYKNQLKSKRRTTLGGARMVSPRQGGVGGAIGSFGGRISPAPFDGDHGGEEKRDDGGDDQQSSSSSLAFPCVPSLLRKGSKRQADDQSAPTGSGDSNSRTCTDVASDTTSSAATAEPSTVVSAGADVGAVAVAVALDGGSAGSRKMSRIHRDSSIRSLPSSVIDEVPPAQDTDVSTLPADNAAAATELDALEPSWFRVVESQHPYNLSQFSMQVPVGHCTSSPYCPFIHSFIRSFIHSPMQSRRCYLRAVEYQ
jgi:hypothetical protein